MDTPNMQKVAVVKPRKPFFAPLADREDRKAQRVAAAENAFEDACLQALEDPQAIASWSYRTDHLRVHWCAHNCERVVRQCMRIRGFVRFGCHAIAHTDGTVIIQADNPANKKRHLSALIKFELPPLQLSK